jgi:acyl-CoA synthetase (AMP-forming)/AMP-acid ligase II
MSFFIELEQYENDIAYVNDQKKVVKYSQLISEADSFSRGLLTRQVALCIATNTAEFLTAYLSFLRHGVVPLLLNFSSTQNDIDGLIDIYKPTYVLMPTLKFAKPNGYTDMRIFGSYQLLVTLEPKNRLDPNLALLLTTSGTTGSSKLVKISYDNLYHNCKSIVQYMELDSDSRAITTLPFSYSYGLSIINTHLFAGGSIILNENAITESRFWETFISSRATHLGGVPFSFEVYKRFEKKLFDTSSLQTLTQAGGKLPKNLVTFFAEMCHTKSIKFFVMYGQTEATARMSFMNCEDARRKPESVGKAIPGGKFFITDSNGDLIDEAGVEGELVYQGPNVAMGYAESLDDLSSTGDISDVLKTGDFAYQDLDGDFFITGRLSRNAKINGIRINLQEIDDFLMNQEFLTATVSDDSNLFVFHVGQVDYITLISVLQEFSKVRISQIKLREVESFPRTSSGKIDFKEVKAWI